MTCLFTFQYSVVALSSDEFKLIENLRSAHTAVFMCFVWISEQTTIISLYNINWLVFVTETECVYCAVRAEALRINQVDLSH